MAYDPQRDRRRPRPSTAAGPAPIDALLDAVRPGGDPAPVDATEPVDDTEPAAGGRSPAGSRSPASGPESPRRRTDPLRGADPPPPVSVTPGPADPWSDRQLLRAVVASVLLTLTGAIAARWLWQRLRAARR